MKRPRNVMPWVRANGLKLAWLAAWWVIASASIPAVVFFTVGSVLYRMWHYVFVTLQRRNDAPERHQPMADRYEAAEGMSYPDRHGRTHRLYDYEQEDVA